MSSPMHVVLVGDSILDNGSYVLEGEHDVTQQLQEILTPEHKVTLYAVDGYSTGDILNEAGDFKKKFPTATHFVLSAGGVDAISKREEMWTVTEDAMAIMTVIQSQFEKKYEKLLKILLETQKHVMVVIPYYPQFQGEIRRRAMFSMGVFNDVILRLAFENDLPVIDLRITFNDESDYASPIEPSASGGLKVAKLIGQVLREFPFSPAPGAPPRRSMIYHLREDVHHEGSAILRSLTRLKNEVTHRKEKFLEFEASVTGPGGKISDADNQKLRDQAVSLDKYLKITVDSRIWTTRSPTKEEAEMEKALRAEIMQFRAWVFPYL